jgi:hypothetical protein
MSWTRTQRFAAIASSVLLLLATGCSNDLGTGTGGGASSATLPTSPNQPISPAPSGANVATITVNTGPYAAVNEPYVNGGFTSVTVCTPGTNNCQTIGGILVDTGSYGLRILSPVLTIPLNQQTDSNDNPIVECGEFASGFTWGPVQTADVTIAGETTTSAVPVQVMGSSNYPDTYEDAEACTDGEAGSSADLDYAESLGANGLLGVGTFAQDCGQNCTLSGSSPSNPGNYYSCPTYLTCTVTSEALSAQVVNPVVSFPVDNNGVVVEMPPIAAGSVATSITGYLIFGIGTESNNGLGNATIYDVDTTLGNFTTEFEGNLYTDEAFADSGSDAMFFDPTGTDLGETECSDLDDGFFCPNSNESFSATNEGYSNGNSSQVSFTVANADSFFDNTAYDGDGIFNGLAGPFSGVFDWGLPFFYGRSVYAAIDGVVVSGVPTGPYVAY